MRWNKLMARCCMNKLLNGKCPPVIFQSLVDNLSCLKEIRRCRAIIILCKLMLFDAQFLDKLSESKSCVKMLSVMPSLSCASLHLNNVEVVAS